VWPRLLTQGARWGGKIRFAELANAAFPAHDLSSRLTPTGTPQAH
jgi:hypothetical protein